MLISSRTVFTVLPTYHTEDDGGRTLQCKRHSNANNLHKYAMEAILVTVCVFTVVKGLQAFGYPSPTTSMSPSTTLFRPIATTHKVPVSQFARMPLRHVKSSVIGFWTQGSSRITKSRYMMGSHHEPEHARNPSVVRDVDEGLTQARAALPPLIPKALRLPLLGLALGFLWQPLKRMALWAWRIMKTPQIAVYTATSTHTALSTAGARLRVLETVSDEKALAPDVSLEAVAELTEGFAVADLEGLMNDASIVAAQQSRTQVQMQDIREAYRAHVQLPSRGTTAFGRGVPQTATLKKQHPEIAQAATSRQKSLFFKTLSRVALPSLLTTLAGIFYFGEVSLYLRKILDPEALLVLGMDESQFMQNFQTVIGLLFSILAGSAYSSLYAQQESIVFALYAEVSEAKSLLEQVTLVCQGRPMYGKTLAYIKEYVENDLRKFETPPADLLAERPADDPLESIMYLTSVGVPSVVYETVRSLRQARAYRLGAMQRKFPGLGIVLLYVLGILVLVPFPLLSAGGLPSMTTGILLVQGSLFGALAGSIVLCLRIIQELWQSSGGVFNVDEVLLKMVSGLEEELDIRSSGLIGVTDGPDAPQTPWAKDVSMRLD